MEHNWQILKVEQKIQDRIYGFDTISVFLKIGLKQVIHPRVTHTLGPGPE